MPKLALVNGTALIVHASADGVGGKRPNRPWLCILLVAGSMFSPHCMPLAFAAAAKNGRVLVLSESSSWQLRGRSGSLGVGPASHIPGSSSSGLTGVPRAAPTLVDPLNDGSRHGRRAGEVAL